MACVIQWQTLLGYTPPMGTSTLRERKKQHTRQALIDAALERFTARGYGAVTLDELCDTVQVSKRTFFRYFAGKEDVAMAPLEDLWTAFTAELRTRELPPGTPLLALAEDVLLAALDRVADERWVHRARLSLLLADRHPSIAAHNRQFCERTTGALLEILRPALGPGPDPADPRPRLALDMLLAAFQWALAGWAAVQPPETAVALAERFRGAVAALPGSLALTTAPPAP